MYMSLKPYYTISPPLLVQQIKDKFDFGNVRLNILLNKETEFSSHFYSILNRVENEYIISICASLLQDRNILSGLLPKVYILLALDRYSNGQKIIPIFSEAHHQIDSLSIEEFQAYLKHQGLDNVKLFIFDYSIDGLQTIDNFSLFVMAKQPAELQNAFSKNKDHARTMIIAFRNEITDFTVITDLQNQIISEERDHTLKTDISQFYMEKEEFEFETELWKKRTLLYQDFLSLSKKIQEKEYYEVLNWYQKEYEILPLWYKRLGHIIKVIMGKRSFRSLFSDNAKKDKE